MRLLVTADLHYNQPRSRALALDLIDRMNHAGGDGLLIVGDTAHGDGRELEECLERFTAFAGPRLFLCGNHELWTRGPDSHVLFTVDLPRRLAALGWWWLETTPFIAPSFAVVGTLGWYDYNFASGRLNLPRRFYDAKMSPGAAAYLGRADLSPEGSDVAPESRDLVARWNDGKFVKLGRSDEAFLDECLANLRASLDAAAGAPRVIAATHTLPFRELLPPSHSAQLEFVKAYLGSPRIGDLLLQYPNVTDAFCGHSHFPAHARVGHITATNIGSSYRAKTFHTLDL